MTSRYILDGHKAVPCPDLDKWANWFENANTVVKQEHPRPGVLVSTVFLGLDCSFMDGPPLLFETMVFGGKFDQDQDRYYTWEEAEKGHTRMVQRVLRDRLQCGE